MNMDTIRPLHFQDVSHWRLWLQRHHTGEKEAWLVILKRHAQGSGVTYEEAVEEALCFGWIDGLTKSIDAETYRIRFSPRKTGSIWSVSNLERVTKLLAQGKMTEAGLAKVYEAQANGEWEAARQREDVSKLPDDLEAALAGNSLAQTNFDRFPPSRKKQLIYWITSARTEKTRQNRIQKTVALAAANGRLGQV